MSHASSPQDPHWGQRIGRYQVLTQLSVGGMAELFLGFTSGPGGFRKYVALKRILPDARDNERFERMFLDEARITAALNHANIGHVFELGQDAEGLFLAMEFIAGQNLNQIAATCRRRGESLPLGFSLSVARDVCLALHYAHTFILPGGKPYPVIHRDVAQKNVMVAYDGGVKLLDFGIAKARDARENTQVGMVKGTAGYMSPEQVRGEPLDGRSDLFSVGVMLHELLTGERLFSAESERQELEMILDAPIPVPSARVPGIPSQVSTVVLKALARPRESRYANGREMARAIEAAAGTLLFDADQRAAFMREHFQERMEVTNRLLESADEAGAHVDSGTARMLGGGVDAGVESAARETREAERDEAPPRQSRSVLTTGRVVAREKSGHEREPEQAGTSRLGPWLLALLVLGGGLGFGAVKLLGLLEAGDPAIPEAVMGDPSPITPIDRLGEKLPPPPQPTPTSESATAEAEAPPPVEAKPPTEAQEGKDPRAEATKDGDGEPPSTTRSVKQGALTLLVLPEAEVFLKGRSLGKTPLIKKPVPVGRHLLILKGEDGKRRVLSVPIAAGKTAQFRLKLTDIPEK
ncbi:MAG TPA: serine/threonine-protein kinase [Archangium sp.]|jgi:serine/threonine-protein kinase|uniref:serine/threonine-protein kinase n=1 Tax=Archangium sp. TaxID=1872627 RepID=UPI002EDB9D74